MQRSPSLFFGYLSGEGFVKREVERSGFFSFRNLDDDRSKNKDRREAHGKINLLPNVVIQNFAENTKKNVKHMPVFGVCAEIVTFV